MASPAYWEEHSAEICISLMIWAERLGSLYLPPLPACWISPPDFWHLDFPLLIDMPVAPSPGVHFWNCYLYIAWYFIREKNKTEIQFHENAVAIMLRRMGRERFNVYLICRYIFKVLLYSDLLSSAFIFSFTSSFHCRSGGGIERES